MKNTLQFHIRLINKISEQSSPALSVICISFILIIFATKLDAQNVSTYAGTPGVQGLLNGNKDSCQFGGAEQMAFDSHGNLYIADFFSNVIRKIDTAGYVTTFAGTPFTPGYLDGHKDSCYFNGPIGIAIDKFDNVYVCDNVNSAIRKIDAAGNVTTLAGGVYGYTDGPGGVAKFAAPIYICFDDSMNLYVADNANHAIRKIDSTGYVSTYAGSGSPGYADGNGQNALFSAPYAITYNSLQQAFYVVDRDYCFIRKINLQRDVTTIAGNGICDFMNGPGNTAMFNEPKGITTDSIGNIYIAGRLDHTIRKIDLQNQVSTFAGTPLTSGYQDGPVATAMFNRPISVTFGPDKALYISDAFNYLIRKIDSISTVTFIPVNFSELELVVYPNPASDYIQVVGLPTNSKYTIDIYNPVGQKVLSQKISDATQLRLDILALSPGVYFIQIASGNSQQVARFIKQ